MKKLSTIFLFSFLFVLSISKISYAKIGGFELIVNVPIGAGITLIDKNITLAGEPKGGGNFQIGVEADIGYMFQIKDNMWVSLLASLGYDFTGFNYSKNNKTEIYKNTVHDIHIGFYPKFNISGFSIGLNVGAKFGVANKLNYSSASSSYSYSSKAEPRTYIRGTFDYSIFFKENMAINVGFYIGYDWGYYWKDVSDKMNVLKNEGYGNLEIGAQVGYRFGPKF
ncbi:hypothetical protein R4K92_10135 [Brachyspira intermedia]|uniref:hypothetical protein n=1 Tax=Brachyspira intermedia TaxID=84377 RepID=UPI00300677A8